MTEYDCWFQSGNELPQGISAGTLSRVYLAGAAADDDPADGALIAENAVREYIRLMHKQFGVSAARVPDASAPCVTLGVSAARVPDASEPCVTLAVSEGAPQKSGGFTIAVEESGVAITGSDSCGLLYGIYRFAALLALGTVHVGDVISDAPVCPLRIVNHWDNMDGTIERGYAGLSLFYKNNRFDYDRKRIEDYARLLASVGINRLSINNVNVKGSAKRLITDEFLPDVARLAAIFRPYGIRLLLSINFAAPLTIGGLDTADPLDPQVAAWWRDTADSVYRHVPDLAGWLVKADAEGEPGPFQYGRNHADGANMLAAALAPHGGEVIWRCFVYNCAQDWRNAGVDRARAAYDTFMPLDGAFAGNVILQIKHGPYDFQVREPVTPLFGALTKTRHLMELQITQEYTGHQIDLCFLPALWQDVMHFDTGHDAAGIAANPTDAIESDGVIHRLLSSPDSLLTGLAAVSNAGLDANWTGHTLAQANLYGYGRLAWNPQLSAADIAAEWSALTFASATLSASASATLSASASATLSASASATGTESGAEPGSVSGAEPPVEGASPALQKGLLPPCRRGFSRLAEGASPSLAEGASPSLGEGASPSLGEGASPSLGEGASATLSNRASATWSVSGAEPGSVSGAEPADTVAELLLRSYPAYEKYTAPFGVCFMVTPNGHYGPSPEGYEFSRWGTYHRADREAIGIDRGANGTGYTAQYAPAVAARFAEVRTCPENLLLFFHRLRYDYRMKNGETLLQNIYDTHFAGCDEVQTMLDTWIGLKGKISGGESGGGVYESVLERFRRQLDNAREWRDVINTYFFRHTGIADARGRQMYR